jgi:RNA polymerase sigma factor (sigma-70 family)
MDSKERNNLFEFFAVEGRNLRRYVLGRIRSISEADAEDIIGDVMLKLFTRPEASGPLDNPAGYVYRALHNKIVDYGRVQSRAVSLESCLDEDGELRLMALVADSVPGPDVQAERRELMHRLGQALDRLEPKQRAVFIATEMDGQSFKELSERWHEPVGTLLSRKSRAVKALRDMLKDYIL